VGAYGVTRRGGRETSVVAVLLAVALGTYLTKISYSPIQFTYPDELQHVRTLNTLLTHRHLFHANPSLPVSPFFPGLEIITDAVMSMTGLSTFAAGLVVAGFSHVVLTVVMYAVFRAIPMKSPAAGLATMVFATEPHFEYFDAIFGYQSVALPLLCLSLLGAIKLSQTASRHDHWRWGAVSVFSAAALLFTHHVSMLVLLILLAILAVVTAPKGSWRCTALLLICTLGTAAWFATGAHGTINYLFQPISENLLSALPGHSTGPTTHGSPAAAPTSDRAVAYLTVLTTLALLLLGWIRVLRSWSTVGAATRMFAVAAVAYPIVLAVRLFAGDSSELAGRALTFVLVAVAATIAPVLARHLRQRNWLAAPLIAAVIAFLAAGGIATGWPPWYERIPGPFKIDSFESGVDRQNLDVAAWAGSHLRPNNHVASDFDTGWLIDTIGNQETRLAVANIFYARRFTPAIWRQIRSDEIHVFVVDRRMQYEQPAAGGYFALTPAGLPAGALPRSGIEKFSDSRRLSRIYDSGAMAVYILSGAHVT
jgi:hypothetical protein